MEESQDRRYEEEDDIHDPERKTSLLHRALLIGTEMDASYGSGPEIAKGDRVWRAGGYVGAVLVGDVAEGVDAADECADEEEIDEGNEAGVVGRAVVGEECCDGPSEGEDGDNEEDEDIVGSEGASSVVDVHKVGEHAHCWDQSYDLHEAPEGEEDSEQHVCCITVCATRSLLLSRLRCLC